MVRVKLIGGLGNQLFQYAAARALAEDLGTILTLDITDFETYDLFDAEITQFALSDRVQIHTDRAATKGMDIRAKLSGNWFKEKGLGFDRKVLSLKRSPTLRGYFQSEKYFARHGDIIRRELVLDKPDLAEWRQDLGPGPKVALHIRRGDYVNIPHLGLCSLDYYRAAMKVVSALRGPSTFVVFSDDPDWVRDQAGFGHDVVMGTQPGRSVTDDFALMASCDHFIIANSSFSWWAAWLGHSPDKVVIAPKPWMDGAAYDTSSVVPDSWTELPKS